MFTLDQINQDVNLMDCLVEKILPLCSRFAAVEIDRRRDNDQNIRAKGPLCLCMFDQINLNFRLVGPMMEIIIPSVHQIYSKKGMVEKKREGSQNIKGEDHYVYIVFIKLI